MMRSLKRFMLWFVILYLAAGLITAAIAAAVAWNLPAKEWRFHVILAFSLPPYYWLLLAIHARGG